MASARERDNFHFTNDREKQTTYVTTSSIVARQLLSDCVEKGDAYSPLDVYARLLKGFESEALLEGKELKLEVKYWLHPPTIRNHHTKTLVDP